MQIKNKYYNIEINDKNGSITSFNNHIKEFIHRGANDRPLFTIRLRDNDGNPSEVNAFDASEFTITLSNENNIMNIVMKYKHLGGKDISATVEIKCGEEDTLSYWNISTQHETNEYIEWIDFPDVVVPNDLIAANGDARVLWPAMEGVLIEDADMRENSPMKYSPIEYPTKGWEGLYPGPCASQFMAYYGVNGGLYFGAHDEESNMKTIEFYKFDGGIRLEYRLYPGGVRQGEYKMKYDMVLGAFSGDWHDAAEIYRSWFKSSYIKKPSKFYENNSLPEWMKTSPVMAIYPVRGQMHMGDMSPNEEYFPFTNALPYIDRLADELDSRIMAMPMQWEGTAPWAPPYVWPPLGGTENFTQFVDGLHKKGNIIGIYCSGIAWTNESTLTPEYTCKDEFEQKNLKEVMCESPKGELPNALICNGLTRWGYDMCPTHPFVSEVAISEVTKIADSGCDYIQYFDQNIGGNSSFCYSKKHGHPVAPGIWQKEALIDLFNKLLKIESVRNNRVVLGCESAAAEPYIQYLQLNDLRYEINLYYGVPVPLYSYIYHEYINNFMGNQNGTSDAVDIHKSPLNLLQRITYSFIAGDMLTVVLQSRGQIHWDWCTPWSEILPNQQDTITLLRRLNEWRKKSALPFICYGAMMKPFEIIGAYKIPMELKNGGKHDFQSVFTSRWMSPEGRNAQIIVNYTYEKQEISMLVDRTKYSEVIMYKKPDGSEKKRIKLYREEIEIVVEPLSAFMIEFISD